MNDRLLLLFSLTFMVWAGLAMVVPYFRRKQDLLTTRNFFLLGAVVFVGFSGINAVTTPHYFLYSSKVYWFYYLGIIVFFAAFELAYRKLKWPHRLSTRHFRTWPKVTGMGLWLPLSISLIVSLGQYALIDIPGVAALVRVGGAIAPAFAMAFALALWYKAKMNPLALAAVALVFVVGVALAFRIGGGRRPLYGIVVAIPICLYWWKLRYLNPLATIAIFLGLAVMVPIGDAAYRAARWAGTRGKTETQTREEGATLRWRMFKDALFNRGDETNLQNKATAIGQNAVENSLLTTYIFKEARGAFPTFEIKPLHSIYVIATLPIPRAIWEDKPRNLGITLPYDSGVLKQSVAKTNWGPGIVGHGYHDGGLLVLVLYGLLAGGVLRFLDNLLVLHPGNPFLMAFLSAASVQIAGWIRGDIATMTPLAGFCFIYMIVLAWITRFVTGTEYSWLPAPGGGAGRRQLAG